MTHNYIHAQQDTPKHSKPVLCWVQDVIRSKRYPLLCYFNEVWYYEFGEPVSELEKVIWWTDIEEPSVYSAKVQLPEH